MVNMFTHTVNMGVGDVAMGFFVGEADDKPTGGICFRDIDQSPIQILPDDYDVPSMLCTSNQSEFLKNPD